MAGGSLDSDDLAADVDDEQCVVDGAGCQVGCVDPTCRADAVGAVVEREVPLAAVAG